MFDNDFNSSELIYIHLLLLYIFSLKLICFFTLWDKSSFRNLFNFSLWTDKIFSFIEEIFLFFFIISFLRLIIISSKLFSKDFILFLLLTVLYLSDAFFLEKLSFMQGKSILLFAWFKLWSSNNKSLSILIFNEVSLVDNVKIDSFFSSSSSSIFVLFNWI